MVVGRFRLSLIHYIVTREPKELAVEVEESVDSM